MVSPDIRQRYKEEILTSAKVRSAGLLEAFATVPREDFVGPGPWKVLARSSPQQKEPQVREVADPGELYRDVAVLLDGSRYLTNGNPVTVASWLDALSLSKGDSVFHLGCGTGYYSAIVAEAVGPLGQVTAVEIDAVSAAQARASLARYPNVEVITGDGGLAETGPRDAILINAGVTHPHEMWLNNLRLGGHLVLPLTIEIAMPHIGKGMVLHVSRAEFGYAAHFFPLPVMIYSCTSMRNPKLTNLLGHAFMSGNPISVNSLRRDFHSPESSCWLHTSSFCLSTTWV